MKAYHKKSYFTRQAFVRLHILLKYLKHSHCSFYTIIQHHYPQHQLISLIIQKPYGQIDHTYQF